jgi:L-aminopeptidase/D-esterase-like protein
VLTDVAGVLVGHWTQNEARTGCTVVLLPPGTTASGEIRGGAPATREFGLLEPWRMIPSVDAVVLSGGSAFGLAAADGVMLWLEEQGRGFKTASGLVPIVVGMSLFDLGVGDPSVRPGSAEGRAAAVAATGGAVATGPVGAGTGATVGKWGGPDRALPGGLVAATVVAGDVVMSALLAVNAYGWVDDGTTETDPGPPVRPASDEPIAPTNTTIGVVVTNAVVDKLGCHLLAQSAHDGLARSLFPAHSGADGDAIVAAATGQVAAPDPLHLRLLAQLAVTRAVRSLLP